MRIVSVSLGVLFDFKSKEISDSGLRVEARILSTFLRMWEIMVVAVRGVFVHRGM